MIVAAILTCFGTSSSYVKIFDYYGGQVCFEDFKGFFTLKLVL